MLRLKLSGVIYLHKAKVSENGCALAVLAFISVLFCVFRFILKPCRLTVGCLATFYSRNCDLRHYMTFNVARQR